MASTSALGSKECPKCGTVKKFGKASCCARGGAWFQKCGDAADTNFDHTWVEGIQACNGLATSLLDEAPVRDHLERNITLPKNTIVLRNAAQQHVSISPISSADGEDCVVSLAKTAVFTIGFFINFYM